MKILVVEDNVPQAESLQLVLGALGHTVYTAASADGAKAKVGTHPPDAVVLDLLLPGGGRQFLEWLRAQPGLSSVPVVVTTGLAAEDAADLARLPGVAVMVKPFHVDEMLAALGRLGEAHP